MRIENGHVILERKTCFTCNGTRIHTPLKPCPRSDRAQRGKPCIHCGSTTKYNHHYLHDTPRPCDRCDANGTESETSYDYAPDGLWQSLEFRVIANLPRSANWLEYNLGIGYIFSITDYGASRSLSDSQLIEKIRAEHRSSQLVQLLADRHDDSPNPRLAPFIAIIRRNDGYNVRAATPADVEAIATN